MARARNIKPGFFRNADLVELSAETRLLFIGLWTLADREGRLEDRPRQIKMELFPADSFDVGSMLDQLQSSGFVIRYEVDSIKVLEVSNFIKHQDPHYKEKASELPPRPGTENFILASAVTRLQRKRILDRDGHECQHCAATEALCIDHVIPVSRGGDSSDDNLQILCSACNTKKGNKLDGETKNLKQRRVDFGATLNQRIDASPSDPRILNPESCSLNPESRILIADSLIPDTENQTQTPFGGSASHTAPAKVKVAKASKEPAPTTKTWEAYATAYEAKYRTVPVRNAMVNGQLAQLVARLGAPEAPQVAAWYLTHRNQFYVASGHSVAMLLRDCEKLRTEWATGRQGTVTQAMQADKTQTNFNAFAPMIAEAQAKERTHAVN